MKVEIIHEKVNKSKLNTQPFDLQAFLHDSFFSDVTGTKAFSFGQMESESQKF